MYFDSVADILVVHYESIFIATNNTFAVNGKNEKKSENVLFSSSHFLSLDLQLHG
jgi:hypothetical protein